MSITDIMGPRDGALRTFCRHLIAKLQCSQYGTQLSFAQQHIDISKGDRTIRISADHLPHALPVSRSFDSYFEPVVPTVTEKGRLVDYSKPALQRYAASGLEFELASLPEETFAIDDYFRWYKPKAGEIVFDVGAYCGVSSYYFSKAIGPSGTVYAFEPDPVNFPLLERNISRHGLSNVIPLQIAISDTSGRAEFCSEGSLGSTLAPHSVRHYPQTVEVRTMTFQEACETYGVPAFAKFDIEGAEAVVLKAAALFLKTHPINVTLDTNHLGPDGKLLNGRVEEILRCCNYEVESRANSGLMTTWARPKFGG